MAFARLQRLRETSGFHEVNNNCRRCKLLSPSFGEFIMKNKIVLIPLRFILMWIILSENTDDVERF